ncbi:exonuclease 3'-5' domain-containing protein 2 [Periplaneta americana]|uniref:3'-5' exonuclease domain-containing protein n=1 Tax=Periplaneta americana TaxID=6978 RepID=A0ABQ8RVX9_PERAM|nr:hypothetical protein ANN_27402 [Periplaneta americana]
MSGKHKSFATGIIWATVGLGVMYFVRKYSTTLIRNLKRIRTSSLSSRHEKIVIVNTSEECQLSTEELRRNCAEFRVLGFDCEWVTKDGKRRPVALMQLASRNGYCALIRLCCVKEIPQDLKLLLADSSVLKVGVAPSDDAQYLLHDHGLVVRGCLDLRHLHTSSRGLGGLADDVLGVQLDKNWRVRCSDWEAPELSPLQQHYSSQDALVAVRVFEQLVVQKLVSWWRMWGPALPQWSRILPLCQRYIDVRYKAKPGPPRVGSGRLVQAQGRAANKPTSRAFSTRQKPLYDNCILQAPDGEVLSTCDVKKAEWYVLKELGVKVSDDPLTVRLLFEPSGRSVDEVGRYYTLQKENRCVVCGSSKSYIRKNVVPHEYRKHFPAVMKDHMSHDIQLLCLDCHLRSNSFDLLLRQQLAVECNAPIGSGEDVKVYDVPDLKRVRSAARALLLPEVDLIPPERRKELQQVVLDYFNATELTADILYEASTIPVSVANVGYEPHGQRVVAYFSTPEAGGLTQLEQRWREHFLTSMNPEYLPALWSVQHNHLRLQQRAAQGRILPEDVAVSGIELNL